MPAVLAVPVPRCTGEGCEGNGCFSWAFTEVLTEMDMSAISNRKKGRMAEISFLASF